MLDKIRGKPKVDPALEEVRRKTAARLAAIVGLTEEAELDTELSPSPLTAVDLVLEEPEPAADDIAGVDEPEEPAAEEPAADDAIEVPVYAATPGGDASMPGGSWSVGAVTGADVAREPDGVAVALLAPALYRAGGDDWDDAPIELEPGDVQHPDAETRDEAPAPVASTALTVVPKAAPVALPANAVGVMATAESPGPATVAAPVTRAATAPPREGPAPLAPAAKPAARSRRRPTAGRAEATVDAAPPTTSPPKKAATRSIAEKQLAVKAASGPAPAPAPAKASRQATGKVAAPAVPAASTAVKPTPAKPANTKRAAVTTASASPVASPVVKPTPAKPASPKRATAAAAPTRRRRKAPSTELPAACPTCGRLLEEVPSTARRCVSCRQRIVPKRIDGRVVLLAEAVIPLFEAERRRLVDGGRLARECGQWLRLAALVGAPADVLEARARAVAARPTREAVTAARTLYATTVDRACRAARRSKDWHTVADLRFRQARAYHRAAGAPVPPEPAVVALHREATEATLRAIAEISREAQLAGGVCCEACSAQSGQVVKIVAERKAASLPHADCPVGLCGCRWEVPERRRAAVTQLARRRAQAASPVARKVKSTAG